MIRGGREGLDQTCGASLGKLSCQATHVAPGQVRACIKNTQALFGGFQSAPSPTNWALLDPSLLEAEPRAF